MSLQSAVAEVAVVAAETLLRLVEEAKVAVVRVEAAATARPTEEAEGEVGAVSLSYLRARRKS